jgi:hypothetical protein
MSRDEILSDPLRAIQSLSADEIENRLDELDRQASALRVLLRSARARAAGAKRQPAKPKEGGASGAA